MHPDMWWPGLERWKDFSGCCRARIFKTFLDLPSFMPKRKKERRKERKDPIHLITWKSSSHSQDFTPRMLSLIDYRCIVESFHCSTGIIVSLSRRKHQHNIPNDRQREIEIFAIRFGSVDLFMWKNVPFFSTDRSWSLQWCWLKGAVCNVIAMRPTKKSLSPVKRPSANVCAQLK